MMKAHDRLTIVRTLHRARELRLFRDLVDAWFERSARDEHDVPADWQGAQAVRSRINQMLPRVIQVVRAAGIGGGFAPATASDPGLSLGRAEVLQRIFLARDGDGLDQEIMDVLDMAIGVYESGRFLSLVRTVNPLHYAMAALGYVAGVPRRVLGALGIRRATRAAALSDADLARLEAVAARLADVEDFIDARLNAVLDRQAVRQADHARQVAELAERLDFTERVLGRREPLKRLEAPE